MNEIPQVSLIDTLNVIQLARETALANGNVEQANRFAPVVKEMQNLVTQAQKTSQPGGSAILGQEDFRQLLDVAQTKNDGQTTQFSQDVVDRNQLIQAMSAANMTDLEIARHMEMTTEEVNLILSMSERTRSGKEFLA